MRPRRALAAGGLAVVLSLAACTDIERVISPRVEDAPRPDLTLRVTQYYTAVEGEYPIGDSTAFLTVDGAVLHEGSEDFYRAAATEGSARLSDGTVLNWHRKVDGEVRWKEVSAAYGLAADGCELVPWRTIAVDPDVVPLGTRVRILETQGITLPDGETHDGIWWANDTGVSIEDDRVDLFTGNGQASMDPLYAAGITHLQPLTVAVLDQDAGCAPKRT